MMRRVLPVALTLVCVLHGDGFAQFSWDAPPLIGPASPQGLGIFVLHPDPDGPIGALLNWRDDTASFGIGYRIGLGEDGAGHAAGFTGVDVSGSLANGAEDARVKLLWWTGLGGGVGSNLMATVPLGIVVGWTGRGESAIFAPYAGGHAAVDLSTRRGNHADLRGAVDLGLDIRLAMGWVASCGLSFGGRDALAVGASLPIGDGR